MSIRTIKNRLAYARNGIDAKTKPGQPSVSPGTRIRFTEDELRSLLSGYSEVVLADDTSFFQSNGTNPSSSRFSAWSLTETREANSVLVRVLDDASRQGVLSFLYASSFNFIDGGGDLKVSDDAARYIVNRAGNVVLEANQ